MDNRRIGILILAISVIIIGIILLFGNAMKKIITEGCLAVKQGLPCPAYSTIAQQTYLALAVVGILIIVGFILVFSKPQTKIIIRKPRHEPIKIDMSELSKEEKFILRLLKENKAMFQADLIEQVQLPKTKITRILDKLEAKGIVERKRRGLNNLVVFVRN